MTDVRERVEQAVCDATSDQAPDWYGSAIYAALDTAGLLVTPERERQAAIGAAVERLADAIAWTLRGGPDGSNTEAWNTQTGAVGSGDTIPAAIAAALGDDDE